MLLKDPTKMQEWLPPHSIQWYSQIGELEGKYNYTWNSTVLVPNGETIFDEEVMKMVKGKKVLDIGCGHGDFALNCSSEAAEVIGFDVTSQFLPKDRTPLNVSFVEGNTKKGLPFKNAEFDCAYNRKGPTSSYPHVKRVVKNGGIFLALHPGDNLGMELPELFPGLFNKQESTPVLCNLQQKIKESGFHKSEIEEVNVIEFLHSPVDVLKRRCFGQHPKIYDELIKAELQQVARIFDENKTDQGLPVTFSRYIVRIVV
ncbi:class I SAM-dependent methyltransferase [Bacillus sp. AK031]